jgi:hypothetical protein
MEAAVLANLDPAQLALRPLRKKCDWIDVSGTTTPAIFIRGQPIKLFCQ